MLTHWQPSVIPTVALKKIPTARVQVGFYFRHSISWNITIFFLQPFSHGHPSNSYLNLLYNLNVISASQFSASSFPLQLEIH